MREKAVLQRKTKKMTAIYRERLRREFLGASERWKEQSQ